MAKNWAIIIGVNQYSYLEDLNFAKTDAEAMYQWLLQEGGFNSQGLFLFTDDSPPIPTKPPIPTTPTFGHLDTFFDIQFDRPLLNSTDNLWFFFSGHGNRGTGGDYLMLSDSNPRRLEYTALSVSYITERLRNWGAGNVVMFIDACRNVEDRTKGGEISQQNYQGMITFYSCRDKEKSLEVKSIERGVFTHVLLQALGKTKEQSRCLTVAELEGYLMREVPKLSPNQHPLARVEPTYKSNFILFGEAQQEDIESLYNLALKKAFVEKKTEDARELLLHANKAAKGGNSDITKALEELAISPQELKVVEPVTSKVNELDLSGSSPAKDNQEIDQPMENNLDSTTGKKSQIQIFIAHASEDKPQVRELYTKLKQAGYKPWLDEEELIPGLNWREEIPKALKSSDLFLACLSSISISKRGYIQKEFRMAMEMLAEMPSGTIYLIPLKLDDCEIPELGQSEYGLNLRDIQWLDYWKPNGFEKLIKAIEHQFSATQKNESPLPPKFSNGDLINNSNNPRLQSLQREKEELEEEYAFLESMRTRCSKQIKGEGDWDKREQLKIKRQNYSDEIDELLKNLKNIEKKINDFQSSSPQLSSNNHLENPKNKQESIIDKYLPYIDFQEALDTFNNIQNQFNNNGDVALFFMEESLTKRGDLCSQRLRYVLKTQINYPDINIHSDYRKNFRYCPVTYTSGNLQAVVQGIANFFDIKNVEDIKLVIKKIGDSLQNNSVLFIEINCCHVYSQDELKALIPWFVDIFWQPLKSKVAQLAKDYQGIKIVAVIISDENITEILLKDNLSCYYNNNDNNDICFARDKLIQIPLKHWTKKDIFEWLIAVDSSLKKDEINEIVEKNFHKLKNINEANTINICHALETRLSNLINTYTSS